jgi:hypothetical protein
VRWSCSKHRVGQREHATVDIGLELGKRRGSDNIGVDEGGRGDEGERHLPWFKAVCNIGRNGARTIAQLVAAHAAKQRPSRVRRQRAALIFAVR